MTEQLLVTGPVVKVFPLSVPPQPVTLNIVLPTAGDITKLVVPPWVTVDDAGLIVPLPLPKIDVVTEKFGVDGAGGCAADCPPPELPPPHALSNKITETKLMAVRMLGINASWHHNPNGTTLQILILELDVRQLHKPLSFGKLVAD